MICLLNMMTFNMPNYQRVESHLPLVIKQDCTVLMWGPFFTEISRQKHIADIATPTTQIA